MIQSLRRQTLTRRAQGVLAVPDVLGNYLDVWWVEVWLELASVGWWLCLRLGAHCSRWLWTQIDLSQTGLSASPSPKLLMHVLWFRCNIFQRSAEPPAKCIASGGVHSILF